MNLDRDDLWNRLTAGERGAAYFLAAFVTYLEGRYGLSESYLSAARANAYGQWPIRLTREDPP